MRDSWNLHRAGLFNFWYYDDEEFHFADGKLLLRGSNGSGKSVTMQSLITVLLDGRKSPDRLDPFGSRSRRMEDYLLGEKEVSALDERTGYLYLEYKRGDKQQYITTGLGLRAKRSQSLDSWGFLILDNRRIGRDLQLYREETGADGGIEKIPLSRRELENRLEDGGIVVRSQREYMELVNKHLFGFASLEAYEELMKLLIQLRSPKLSKDFKPTVIYEILNESLPALTDEELRPLSDTIETMDQTKSQLDQLLKEQQSLKRLCRQYDLYNESVRLEKAEALVQTNRRRERLQRRSKELDEQIRAHRHEWEEKQERLSRLRQEYDVLSQEKEELEQHDVFRAERQKQELQTELEEWRRQLGGKEQTMEQKKRREMELNERLRQEEDRRYRFEQEMERLLEEMEELSDAAAFLNHEVAAAEFTAQRTGTFSFALWKKEAADHAAQLEQILDKIREEMRAKERYAEAEAELGETRKELDHTRLEEEKQERLLDEERQIWVNRLHEWQQTIELLRLDEPVMRRLRQNMLRFPHELDWDGLKAPLVDDFHEKRDRMRQQQLQLLHRLEEQERELTAVQEELHTWKKQKDPEPPRHVQTDEAREQLRAQEIPHLPFYAAVEFVDGIDAVVKERIETAIREAGLLDALIVPEAEADQIRKHDRVLKPSPRLMAHTLADYLYPTPDAESGVSAADIDAVLTSILVGEEEDAAVSVFEDGSYRIGLVKGHAPQEERSLFIGKESRKQLRLREIARLEAELEQRQREKKQTESELAQTEERIDRLLEELRSFPVADDVRQAYVWLEQTRQRIGVLEQEEDRRNNKLKQTWESLQQIRAEVRASGKMIPLQLREELYTEARAQMRLYERQLTELELVWKDDRNSRMQSEQLHDRLEEIEADLDEVRAEIGHLNEQIRAGRLRMEQIDARLRELGADEIRDRITRIIRRLEQLPQWIEADVQRMSRLETELEQWQEQREQTERVRKRTERLLSAWLNLFAEEMKLIRTFTHENKSSSADEHRSDTESQDGAADKASEWIQEARRMLEENRKREPEADKIISRLNQVFYEEQAILIEYRLTQQSLQQSLPESLLAAPATSSAASSAQANASTSTTDVAPSADDDSWNLYIDELKKKSVRLLLVMEYKGKRVSPYAVLEQIGHDIELNRQLLNDKDRELYEEIIMNSVGRIIRARIGRAERWVEQMNRLMDERDTSSGLNFSIRWRPKTALHEDELDTKELVSLLRSDPRLLKEEDMNRITGHFRSKIEKAKQMMEDKGYGESFHQLIKEMLDYRNWFSFTLYYRRQGESRKELTNHVFYTFSGGEKAMAMYIPLFSAAYSRYSDARPDAPRIISLDEAFAGVDENNIRDMFDLVEKLGFNYIMNSQALWGDYDTVNRLAVCELVRPKNAPYVTVVRYFWNGNVRTLLHADEMEQKVEATSGR